MSNRPPAREDAEFKILDPAAQVVGALPPMDRHPGLFVRDVLLPEYGIDISKAARAIGVNRANLSEVLAGKRDVSRDLAYRLGALMRDQVADLLIAWQNAWDLERERDRRAAFRQQITRLPNPEGHLS